jgi:CRISPR-associated endonuclease/helicase Cas3
MRIPEQEITEKEKNGNSDGSSEDALHCQYYAKSENGKYTETLFSHLSKTLDNAIQLTDRYGIEEEGLQKAIRIAAAFHDIGKADYRFQISLIDKDNSKGHGVVVYHPLLGLPVLQEVSSLLLPKTKYRSILKSLILFAVASHHTPLHQDLYSSVVRDEFDPIQILNVKDRNHFKEIVFELSRKICINNNHFDDVSSLCMPNRYYTVSCFKLLQQAKWDFNILDKKYSLTERLRVREYFIMIQGVLNYSDWLSSDKRATITTADSANLFTMGCDFIPNPYHYQLTAKEILGNIMITLPTGSGKTETAIMWIMTNFSPGSRIFYTLPTRTTINAMYQRLIDPSRKYGLDKNVVAEYFSNVDLYLTLEGSNPKHANINLYKHFFYPFNVTTPDQLILSMMNHGRYTLKSIMMKKSLVVFDEIHAYDAETFGLIKGLIKYLHKHYESKFCIMSATFPEVLKKELSFLKAKELIENKKDLTLEYKKRRRTRIEYNESYISQNLEQLISSYYPKGKEKMKKKVLIVMNTVKRAQNTFIRLQNIFSTKGYPHDDLMLIHGRFTFGDRNKLERRLTGTKSKLPMILVATQIVEVSLDIDYDVMFTEACYPDSHVQRAGRINRRGDLGNNGEGLIRVFPPEGWYENKEKNSLPYDERLLSASIAIIKDRATKITSELDYISITNDFYNENWTSNSKEVEERYERIWQELSYIYKANLSEPEMIKLQRTRSGIISVTAYSRTHWDKIVEFERKIDSVPHMNTDERYNLYLKLRMYSINVPVSKSIKLKHRSVALGDNGNGSNSNSREYLIAEADYDSTLGLLIDM